MADSSPDYFCAAPTLAETFSLPPLMVQIHLALG